MKKTVITLLAFLVVGNIAISQNFLNKGKGLITKIKGTGFSQEEAAKAIKESLIKGTSSGTETVSKTDGYFKNPEIKIPFPEDVKKVEQKLRTIGAGKKVDEVILSINRAAEMAAIEAKPIFITAIKQLTVRDAINIVRGEDDAATKYLNRTTNAILYEKFKPIIVSALEKTNATKHWKTVITTYNRIPMIKKANPDLEDYVTKKAIYGLFIMIAREEKRIRKNPAARTTDLLKKVFGG